MLARGTPRKPAAVISNFFLPNHPEQYLERFGLRSHFRFVVDSAQFGYKKPDLRIFRHAIERAGLSVDDAPRILYIGDLQRSRYPAPALQIGMQVRHFNRGRSQERC